MRAGKAGLLPQKLQKQPHALEDAGGLDALYVEPGVSAASSTSQGGTPVTISATVANGETPLPTTNAHLHTIDWDGESAHVASPNPGAKCQITHARVRVATSKAGGVKFKLWTKVGNEPMQSQFVEAWSSFVSPGKYEAVFTKKISVSKTTSVQAMAEDKTNPIGQSTGWKQVSLDCTGAGGGGFAGTPGTANPSDKRVPARVFLGEARPIPNAPPSRPKVGEARPPHS